MTTKEQYIEDKKKKPLWLVLLIGFSILFVSLAIMVSLWMYIHKDEPLDDLSDVLLIQEEVPLNKNTLPTLVKAFKDYQSFVDGNEAFAATEDVLNNDEFNVWFDEIGSTGFP